MLFKRRETTMVLGVVHSLLTSQIQFDIIEQHLISTSIKEQAEAFKGKVTELDESLGISTTASAWATSASNFFGETASMLRRNSTTLVRSVCGPIPYSCDVKCA